MTDFTIDSGDDLNIDALVEFLSRDIYGDGLLTGEVSHNGPEYLLPITMDSLLDAYDTFQETFRGIHVTKIVPPEQGWPMAFYCPICKQTTFLLSPWATKPADGDYLKMHDMCASPEFCFRHNLEFMQQSTVIPMIEIPPSTSRPFAWLWGEAI